MTESFELTVEERELVEELSWMLAHAIEQACPRLVVNTIDLELAVEAIASAV